MRKFLSGAALIFIAASPLAAQSSANFVSAREPAGLVIALMNAGYDVDLQTDQMGDPMIKVEGDAYPISVLFYGCDKATNDNCDSIQLVTGLDRNKPWKTSESDKLMRDLRFISVYLDNEGDPIFTWDVFTGDGIPTVSFLTTVERFEDSVRLAADKVFAK